MNICSKLGFALAILLGFFPCTNTLQAQDSLPVCNFQYSDADGDGFGWENSSSCVVTNESQPAPTIINEQTAQVVELVRPYWDGNTDFANRLISCDLYFFDDVIREYVLEPSTDNRWANVGFEHLPIPSFEPYQGWAFPVRVTTNGPSEWTVEDGLYRGNNLLRANYIETVQNAAGKKAIRIWVKAGDPAGVHDYIHFTPEVDRDGYYVCEDRSGADFGPSGRPGQPAAREYQLADLTFSGEMQESDTPQDLVNLETGQPVILQKVYWDYNNDLAGPGNNGRYWQVGCEYLTWNSSVNEYRSGSQQPTYYMFAYAFDGADSGDIRFHASFEGQQWSAELEIENGIVQPSVFLPLLFRSDVAEITGESGFRIWSDSESHTVCWGTSPTGSGAEQNEDQNTLSSSGQSNSMVESAGVEIGNSAGNVTETSGNSTSGVETSIARTSEVVSTQVVSNEEASSLSEVNPLESSNESGGGAFLELFLTMLLLLRIRRTSIRCCC